MRMPRLLVAVFFAESVTVATKVVVVLAAVGVPVMAPVEALSVRPAGRVVLDQV